MIWAGAGMRQGLQDLQPPAIRERALHRRRQAVLRRGGRPRGRPAARTEVDDPVQTLNCRLKVLSRSVLTNCHI